jgi:CheY-like chemotaxis protein
MNSCETIAGSVADHALRLCPIAKRLRFLYVDDSEFVSQAICSILINKGWDCKSATSGNAALQCLTSSPESIDILITDHQMPEMSGLEFVRKVRTTAYTGKILVHSTMLHGEVRAAYEELEVDAIVPKTGNPQLFLKAIQELQHDKSFAANKETNEM